AYSYCKEDGASFLYPKTLFRGDTGGVAIGEFPIYSWMLSLPCHISRDWSDNAARLTSFILFFLGLYIWGLFFQSRLQIKWPGWPIYLSLALFSSQTLTHYFIILPDVASFLLIGVSAFFYEKKSQSAYLDNFVYKPLSIIFFTMGFLTRPYMIPLLAIIIPFDWGTFKNSMKKVAPYLVLSILGYIFWFKYWSKNSEVTYFAINFKIIDFINQWQTIVGATFSRIFRDVLNYVGLIPLAYLMFKKKITVSDTVNITGGIILIWGATTYAVINHGYYLNAVSLIIIFYMISHWNEFPKKWATLFIFLWSLIGLSSNVHQFDPKRAIHEQAHFDQIKLDYEIKDFEKIVVYQNGWIPEPFYRMKAMGHSWPPETFDEGKSCPKNVRVFYLAAEKRAGYCLLEK
ncbi:MAG: hypothetical protein ACK5V3_01040, partial [Bdellovibrionales bacterium]